ncbi:uncharacterized protein LOC118172780 isoform X2 [Oxyura jamaicensis]|uniref:uncharacterized protein LOC118172780 isoform X2 n=1 Tax=Oxyura jamaicensis TaxID=8884 RepID=UPI0015A653FC|nr:uncharacterized protein LOC118172780 isoform X2 [Oxyura jamaicensis]
MGTQVGTRGQTGPSLPTRGSRAAAGPPHPPPSDEDVAKEGSPAGPPWPVMAAPPDPFSAFFFFFFPFFPPLVWLLAAVLGRAGERQQPPAAPAPCQGGWWQRGSAQLRERPRAALAANFPASWHRRRLRRQRRRGWGWIVKGSEEKKKKKNGHMPSLERRGCQNASRQRGAETRRRGEEGLKPVPARVAVHGGRAERRRRRVAEAGQVADSGAGEEKGPRGHRLLWTQPCWMQQPQPGPGCHRATSPTAALGGDISLVSPCLSVPQPGQQQQQHPATRRTVGRDGGATSLVPAGCANSHQSPNTLGPGDRDWSSPAMGSPGFRSMSRQRERLIHPPHTELYQRHLPQGEDLAWGRCQQELGG